MQHDHDGHEQYGKNASMDSDISSDAGEEGVQWTPQDMLHALVELAGVPV